MGRVLDGEAFEEDGLTALVLDHSGGDWRVLELELTTGRCAPVLDGRGDPLEGSGDPTALALSRDGRGRRHGDR